MKTDKTDLRAGKLSRPLFVGENSGASMNMASVMSGRLSPPITPALSKSDRDKLDADRAKLEAILRKPAHTPEEKYETT